MYGDVKPTIECDKVRSCDPQSSLVFGRYGPRPAIRYCQQARQGD